MPLDKELLQLLACPKCKGTLHLCPAEDGLRCDACNIVYPVKDQIPVMLVDESVPVEEWQGSK